MDRPQTPEEEVVCSTNKTSAFAPSAMSTGSPGLPILIEIDVGIGSRRSTMTLRSSGVQSTKTARSKITVS